MCRDRGRTILVEPFWSSSLAWNRIGCHVPADTDQAKQVSAPFGRLPSARGLRSALRWPRFSRLGCIVTALSDYRPSIAVS